MLALRTPRIGYSKPIMRPIVAVIGTTGVGKSQLAVHLAQCLDTIHGSKPGHEQDIKADTCPPGTLRNFCNSSKASFTKGKVLSADSMQLYKGLDVITNKVTEAEMGGVEHWGLDMVQPGQGGSWELGKWCTEAGKVVDALTETTLPVICGGTHYFIQHFLFPPPELSTSRPSSPSATDKGKAKATSSRWSPPHPHPETPNLDIDLSQLLETFWTTAPMWPSSILEATEPTSTDSIASTSTASGAATWTDSQLLSLHNLLAAVDPREAGRWHWRDGRKVKRGLERWWEGGGAKDGNETVKSVGRRARFRTLIFWVYEPMATLRLRLDKRIDKMVENGLLREIAELRGIAREIYGSAESADHTEGIFQTIGYKEFSNLPIDTASSSDPTAHPLFPSMLERMKISTHQYAKSQLKWIKNQLLPAVREARASGNDVWVYAVPGGAANESITQSILSDFITGEAMPDPIAVGHVDSKDLLAPLVAEVPEENVLNIANRQAINARRECDICSTPTAPFSVKQKDWDLHVKSRSHKRSVVAADGGREALIERQKQAGLQRKAERERQKVASLADLTELPSQTS